MDMSQTIEADSTQVNAVDLTGSSRVVTITGISGGPDRKQPINLELAEFPGRAYRPCKSMRRVLVRAWGADGKAYVGRRMELFNDESVKWGGKAVGGIRIKSLSDIPERFEITLQESQKSYVTYRIDPLPDAPTPSPSITDDDAIDFERDIAEATTMQALNKVGADLRAANLGGHADKLRAAWSARKAEIEGGEK